MDSSRVSSARIDTRTDERTDGRTEREATCHRPRIFRCIASPFSAYLNDTIVLYERSDIEVGERKALCLASCLRACIPSPCSASPLPAFCLQSARSRSLRSSLSLSSLLFPSLFRLLPLRSLVRDQILRNGIVLESRLHFRIHFLLVFRRTSTRDPRAWIANESERIRYSCKDGASVRGGEKVEEHGGLGMLEAKRSKQVI